MYEDALNVLPAQVIELRAWLNEWYDHAYKIGYVQPPFRFDDTIIGRLEGYFKAGLTPAEGVSAFFGALH